MQAVQTKPDDLMAANFELSAVLLPETENLFVKVFGEEPQPMLQMKMRTIEKKEPRASFSKLMTFAHNMNRRYGHSYTSGCHCHSCEVARNAV